MYKIVKKKKYLEQLPSTTLIKERIIEEQMLQQYIINSWKDFKNEISLPNSFVIGQRINPDNSTQNLLDILAFDADDLSMVVIELKRNKDKYQLLQGLSYASMIAQWDKDKLLSEIEKQKIGEYEDLLDIIKNNEISENVKVMLIAEKFDPEVVITSDWLTKYNLDISIFALKLNSHEKNTFIHIEQRYPLKELSDVYDRRSKIKNNQLISERSWQDVMEECEYEYAEKIIKMCQKIKSGEPNRKRFSNMLKQFANKFKSISIHLPRKYVKVYIIGANDDDIDFFEKLLSKNVKVSSWRDGISFEIFDENDFIKICDQDARLKYK